MFISEVSIRRPVLSTVMSLLIMLAGLAAYTQLPVREYPDVDNPVVSIQTVYVGANSQTVETTVTQKVEESINGIDGIRTITSTSAQNVSSVNVEFETGRDIDQATTDVTNAVQAILGDLPSDAERPVISKSATTSRAVMWLTLHGEHYTPPEVSDMAERIVKTPLQVLPGVASIIIGGQRKYGMRIWLDPDKMAAHHVDPRDIQRTILENNLQIPAGEIEGTTRRFSILADAQISDPEVFANLVIRREGDQVIRIRDVGGVELGSSNYRTITRFKGQPVIGVGIVRQSRANELAVTDAVREMLPAIRANLPGDVDLDVAVDNSVFVRASLKEVWGTLVVAFILVVLVNLFFLRSFTATLIPSIAIPVSVVGTFAAMQWMDFSVNVLTLLALVLAIGLLVDDAIVMMENIYRHQEMGEDRETASYRGSREVGFAVIATTVSLVAVLIPLALLTSKTGRLFREFSITVAVSVCISTFIALTLVPTMCSKFLDASEAHGKIYEAIERFLNWLNYHYNRALEWSMAHSRTLVWFLIANVVVGAGLYSVLPKTLVPVEDRGQFLTAIKAPRGSTLAYTDRILKKIEGEMAEIPEVSGYFGAIGLAIGGAADTAKGFMYTRLISWDDRARKQQSIVGGLFPKFFSMPEAMAFPINLPSLGLGRTNDIEFLVQSSSASLDDLLAVANRMRDRMEKAEGLVNVDHDVEVDNPQINLVFRRDRAADLGIPVSDLAGAMRSLFAEQAVSEFVLNNKTYDVITALYPSERTMPESIEKVQLRGKTGEMIPLGALVDVVPTVAPAELNHFGLVRSATLTASLAPGFALGKALEEVETIAKEELPEGFTTALGGASREFAESEAALSFTFIFAIIFIYLILSAQFENFIHPFIILLSVPLALLGAVATLAGLYWFGTLLGLVNSKFGWHLLMSADFSPFSINLYSQIGIILLVGLVTKNSILLVDYANQQRANGMELVKAITEAGRTRFRPILMTSVTSILGAVPLMLATGAGAESRRPIGAAVVGGLTFSTIFTLVVIPVVYVLVVKLAERSGIRMIPPVLELSHEAQLAPVPERHAEKRSA